jgi:hypothetical protein
MNMNASEIMKIVGSEKAHDLAAALSDPIVISGKTVQQVLEEWAVSVLRKQITEAVKRMSLPELLTTIEVVQ